MCLVRRRWWYALSGQRRRDRRALCQALAYDRTVEQYVTRMCQWLGEQRRAAKESTLMGITWNGRYYSQDDPDYQHICDVAQRTQRALVEQARPREYESRRGLRAVSRLRSGPDEISQCRADQVSMGDLQVGDLFEVEGIPGTWRVMTSSQRVRLEDQQSPITIRQLVDGAYTWEVNAEPVDRRAEHP